MFLHREVEETKNGAFATPYFVLYNKWVASSITAQGRDLTRTMHERNEHYWYEVWHTDTELHKLMSIKDVTAASKEKGEVSIYADTDSLFVSFKPAIDHCTWQNLILNPEVLNKIGKKFIILGRDKVKFENDNCIGQTFDKKEFVELINQNPEVIIIDGKWVKDREVQEMIKGRTTKWNWSNELDFIMGLDYFRYAGYFKKCLEDYAESFGVANREDFELERVCESIINVAKKKYIQNIVYEDGILHDRLSYLYPKGVELVRSSTPLFARDKIINIVKYLFSHPDDFNIKDLLKLVRDLKKEFEMCVPDKIDDISMQSSCSNYEDKVICDTTHLEFVGGAHFAVKASGLYNHLLHKNKKYQDKYEFIKSGSKIKYYYCKNSDNAIFAYTRGAYPIEFAPDIDLDIQFQKCILSPINSLIEPLNLPNITKRLTVVLDIFGNYD